jgi:hypothetical protein
MSMQSREGAGLSSERELPGDFCSVLCYRDLAACSAPVAAGALGIAVYVNDAVAWSTPLSGPVRGYAIAVSDIRPRRGKVKVRLELLSSNRLPLSPSPAPAVHFEYATFRMCAG